MKKTVYFTSDLFQFLSDLKDNNDREWFQENKARYEAQARDPFLRLIADLRPGVELINPRIVVDPSPTRGSMFRIYRDIRFSSDKSPYKTHMSAFFEHARSKGGADPGYYLHLQPGRCMVAAGLWHPEPRVAQKVRNAIVANPKRWREITGSRKAGAAYNPMGDSLKRPPAGIDAGHPLIEDLKRKDFATSAPLAEKDVLGPNLVKVILTYFKATAPFIQFLSEAVGLK